MEESVKTAPEASMEESVKTAPEASMEESVKTAPEASSEEAVHLRAQMDQALELTPVDPGQYSPLALAYIGDAVYEVLVRTRVLNHGSVQVNKMHKRSAGLVCAQAQAEMALALVDTLSPEELAVYKRGRNAKSATMAKHATMREYRTATGFEALVGYLYLKGSYARLLELVHAGLEKMGEF